MDNFADIPFNIPSFDSIPFDLCGFCFEDDRLAGGDVVVSTDNVESVSQIDLLWLLELCERHTRACSGLALSAFQLCEEIVKVVKSFGSQSNDLLQGKLYELFGDEGFEVMFEILQHLSEVAKFSTADLEIYRLEKDFDNLTTAQRKKLEKKLRLHKLHGNEVSSSSKGKTDASQTSDWLVGTGGFSREYLETERMLGLQGGSARGNGFLDNWRDNLAPAGTREFYEKKSLLPAGATKTFGNGFEEIHVEAQRKVSAVPPIGLVAIDSLEEWAQLAFPGTKTLNRIQSEVFNAAYNSAENLLICAPTGAGKTNIAMLSFLQLVKQHIRDGQLDKDAIKAVYIAPMKALAQEVVTKFKERLDPLGLIVREFTGDMQLTKQEVAESHLLVSTPEKYDVITRKGGEGSLGSIVSLIIIDEVHLLADERGAVIETIVARTQRLVESAQRMVRIVGLSATLPNYHDVATFLRVNSSAGLFFFGPEFRPVPLEQTFIGVTEKQRFKQKDLMNRLAYEKMVQALLRGKQVMIFVHSRKDTAMTAEAIREHSARNATLELLENIHHEKYTIWKKQVEKSRNKEVQQLFYQGMGIHHAGMLRSDRTMTEELFEQGLIKVLFCTATLAWGVNLPAHTVIIKGTEMYDPERGGIVDVSVLDVVQIFGRAGRPQYDTTGHAILVTTQKSLNNYLSLLSLQTPIESNFIKALADHLNAEIVNGTVNNVREGCAWLEHTFLFVRMCRNPQAYGMNYDERFSDPQLDKKRLELITAAAQTLDQCMMCRYDPRSGNLAVTDLGRIASHYYIKHSTISAFNSMLSAHLSEADALHTLCSSSEFDQLKLRPEELDEIDRLKNEAAIEIRGSSQETSSKVSALLQGYLNQSRLSSFTLQSDTNYVSQNAGRICRALFEIALKRGWSSLANQYLSLCKCIDRRIRPDQCLLRQFLYDELPKDVLKRMEDLKIDVNKVLDMSAVEVGQLVHNTKLGGRILSLVKKLPHLHVECIPQPLTRGVMRLLLDVSCDFEWNDRYHGTGEPFYIWIEDGTNECIYHSEKFMLLKARRNDVHRLEFIIPVSDPLPPQYYVRAVSDRWVGCCTLLPVSFQHLILPDRMPPHTELLDMHPVPTSALNNVQYQELYKFSHFNPIQSQVFHCLYHTDTNVLVGAPTGSGKTIIAELAFLRLLSNRPRAKAVYVAPLKALARERLVDWTRKLSHLNLSILELTGDVTPDSSALDAADLLIVTPEKWDSISRGWHKRGYVQRVELVIIDEIHLLGVDRGPVLEIIVSRMRFISCQTSNPIRFVGLSTALSNPRDLADWLGIGVLGVYNFRPSVRPVPMSIHIQGFPGAAYCPRMATMNKPAFAAIKEHSPTKPTLIFVSSRRQTRLTALDLISYCAGDDNPRQFLHAPDEEIITLANTFRDQALRDCIQFGVGIHHAGLDNHDRQCVEELFLTGKIQVLVCTATLAWGVNLPAHLVIIKGTEFYDSKLKRYVDMPVTDVLQMMGRAGRPQFDDTGIACVFVHEPKKNFYKKFLHEPFPVESSLHHQLHEHINAEVVAASITSVQDALEYLSWTFYFRRLVMNPSYYGLADFSAGGVQKHLKQLVDRVVDDLVAADCLSVDANDGSYSASTFGRITSHYYLHYRTVWNLRQDIERSLPIGREAIGSAPTNSVQRRLSNIDLELSTMMRVLCDAAEISELPVRHNEDTLNMDLSEVCPWPIAENSYGSPHSKAFLLMQAHFHHIKLPIIDYLNDTKLVLDQMPRVLNAAVDACAEIGNFRGILALTTLSKMMYQGNNYNVNELNQLPIEESEKQQLIANGIRCIRELHRVGGDATRNGSIELESLSERGVGSNRQKKSGAAIIEQLSKRSEFCKAINAIPYIVISVNSATIVTQLNGTEAQSPLAISDVKANPFLGTKTVESHFKSVSCGTPTDQTVNIVSISIHLRRYKNVFSEGSRAAASAKSRSSQSVALFTPKYHKAKSLSWWLVLTTAETTVSTGAPDNALNNEQLLAVKAVSVPIDGATTILRCQVPLSSARRSCSLMLYLLADSAFGIDQCVQFTLNNA